MPCIEDGPLTETEVKLISIEIKESLRELVKIMEMEYSFNEVVSACDIREPSYTVLFDYAVRGGTRYELAQFLNDAKFIDLSLK